MDTAVVGCPCPSPTTCLTFTCNPQNVCERTEAPAGSSCGESSAGICSAGLCVIRGCGDGYREPGPTPAAERCDDGNQVSGDGCTACIPEQRTIAADPTAESDIYVADGSRAIGIDGSGRALVVWARDEYTPHERTRLHARRYDANGAAMPGELLLDADLVASPPIAAPAVAGLPNGGWVVAWTAFRSSTYDIAFRIVHPDGTLSSEQIANFARASVQRKPAIAALDNGFVIAWQSGHSTPGDPDGGVYAQRFATSGIPEGAEIVLMSLAEGIQANVSLAARGAAWIAVWTDQQLENDYLPSLRMRRFRGGTATDASQREPFSPVSSQPYVLAHGTGYTVAYRTTHIDPAGDIEQIFIPETGPPDELPVVAFGATGVAEQAPVMATLDATHLVTAHATGPEDVILATDSSVLPAEWTALISALASTSATRVALASSPFGLWVVWQSSGHLGGGYGAAAWFWPSP